MTPLQAVLAQYGLQAADMTPLSGGTINRVWRVEAEQGSYVLKQYVEPYGVAQVRQSIVVHQAAFAQGLPVPEVIPNAGSDVVTEAEGGIYVLSRFVPGRLYEPGCIPATRGTSHG